MSVGCAFGRSAWLGLTELANVSLFPAQGKGLNPGTCYPKRVKAPPLNLHSGCYLGEDVLMGKRCPVRARLRNVVSDVYNFGARKTLKVVPARRLHLG